VKKQTQDKLTKIGPGTEMGELMRRYWFPVAASSEIECGRTRSVRLLGEDLVLFRQPNGDLGLLAERCPHRLASLCYGHVDDEGLSCPYHGWKFNKAGKCLTMPAENKQKPQLLARADTQAYLAEELGGLVFAYLGPMPAPLLPRYDLFVIDNVLRDIGYAIIPCNWLQIMENSVDPTHVEWLHGHHLAGEREKLGKKAPTYYRKHQVKIGFDIVPYGIIKRRVIEGGDETCDDWTVGHPLIFPCMLRVGTQGQHRFQIRVPVDDTHTLHFWYSCYLPEAGSVAPKQTDVPLYEVPWQDERGNFITDFVDGGDIMAWITQGEISDRTKELLVNSDKGIVLYRKLLLEQSERVRNGDEPMGLVREGQNNDCIEFSQELNKFSAGKDFLREAIDMSHVRYSPIKSQIIDLLGKD
jgi:5,5'-dehydrodivanillate O-demethylase oxygenase subunit